MANEMSPDLSPNATLMQIQRRPHSTPFHSGSSSSDDAVEGTLFQRVSTRRSKVRRESVSESESVSEICTKLAGFSLTSLPLKNETGQVMDSKKVEGASVVGFTTKRGIDHQSSPAKNPDKLNTPTEDVSSSDINGLAIELRGDPGIEKDSGRSDKEDLDVTFVLEAKQRSDEKIEQDKVTVFNYLVAAEEEIESYGGNLPKSMRKGVLKQPDQLRQSTSAQMTPSLPDLLTADTSTNSSVSFERIIKTAEDIVQFKEYPKQLFVNLLHKYLSSNPVNPFAAQQIAVGFVQDLIKKYKYKDVVRFRSFNHLLCHVPIHPYSLALVYLQNMRRTQDYKIVENLFLRGCELEKASALCTLCNNQH